MSGETIVLIAKAIKEQTNNNADIWLARKIVQEANEIYEKEEKEKCRLLLIQMNEYRDESIGRFSTCETEYILAFDQCKDIREIPQMSLEQARERVEYWRKTVNEWKIRQEDCAACEWDNYKFRCDYNRDIVSKLSVDEWIAEGHWDEIERRRQSKK